MRTKLLLKLLLMVIGLGFGGVNLGFGQDIDEARQALRVGEYAKCVEMAKRQVEQGIWNEEWPRLLLEAYLVTGQYGDALLLYESVIEKFSSSLPLRMMGGEIYRLNNLPKASRDTLGVIPELLERMPWRYTNKESFVLLGEFFLQQGEDPKRVLESCYDRALKQDAKYVPALVATAKLALAKHDGPLATKSVEKAIGLEDGDPDLYCLGAKAWLSADNGKATEYLVRALEINPLHVPSLMFQAEVRMDSEDYGTAVELLKEVEKVNPRLPRMWALRAAIAHLQGSYREEGEYRRRGLEAWPLNPEVDHVIGKQLSSHYRFAESAQYQRRALDMDGKYVAAQAQLAHDLLRLGDDEGWRVVDRVRQEDPYDVSIYNLKQLQGLLEKFTTLEGPGFLVRMETREANIYGQEVLGLLGEARRVLVDKYQAVLEEPVVVEIFPRQKEFAVRTFGLPGGEGFLGVCFGRLITANSPAALQVEANWKGMLWHEYCHVVTLQKTKNRMPRWLSEGISVYEERQRDGRWGQSMSVAYRPFLMSEDLIPVSRLSSAFQRPPSPAHLDFAYFHASLVVEYFVERYGLAALNRVLEDLGVGMSIEEALQRHVGNMLELDADFESYARLKGEGYLPTVDWEMPEKAKTMNVQDWKGWYESHPTSVLALRRIAEEMVGEQDWAGVIPWLKKWEALEPGNADSTGLYALMGKAYHELGERELEYAAFEKLVANCPDAGNALERLMHLDRQGERWERVSGWCEQLMAIDPMRTELQEMRAESAERMGAHAIAIAALRAWLEREPIDPANVWYRLAVQYAAKEDWEASRQAVLRSLEEAPRYREALELLLRLQTKREVAEVEVDSKVERP